MKRHICGIIESKEKQKKTDSDDKMIIRLRQQKGGGGGRYENTERIQVNKRSSVPLFLCVEGDSKNDDNYHDAGGGGAQNYGQESLVCGVEAGSLDIVSCERMSKR